MLQINVDNDANHPTTGHLSFRRIRSRAVERNPSSDISHLKLISNHNPHASKALKLKPSETRLIA